jgi:hypothetical protein
MATNVNLDLRSTADKSEVGTPQNLKLGAAGDRPWVIVNYPFVCNQNK